MIEENNEPVRSEEIDREYDAVEPEEQTVSFRLFEKKPVMTWVLLGVTVLVYLLQTLSEYIYGADLPLALGAKISPYIRMGQYWRLLTPIFLHGSLSHILFNMYSLYSLGPSLEHYYGHWNFLRFYLISGLAGNVLSHIASPRSVSVGASTALFGLIAAQAMLIYKNRRILRNYRSALRNIAFVILVNLLLGLQGGIDNWGHLGGLLGGMLLAWLCGPEITFFRDPVSGQITMGDAVPASRREISCLLVTLFLAALGYAF